MTLLWASCRRSASAVTVVCSVRSDALDLQEEQVPRGRDPAVARYEPSGAGSVGARREARRRAPPLRRSVRLPGRSPRAPIVKRLRRVCAGVRVRRRNRVVLRPALRSPLPLALAIHLPSRPDRGADPCVAGHRRRGLPGSRCAGATSSAHTRPASGRTRSCPAREACCGSTSRGTESKGPRTRRSPPACWSRRSSTRQSGCCCWGGRCPPGSSGRRRPAGSSGNRLALGLSQPAGRRRDPLRAVGRRDDPRDHRFPQDHCVLEQVRRECRSEGLVAICGRWWQALDWAFRLAATFALRAFRMPSDLTVSSSSRSRRRCRPSSPLTPADIGTEQALLVYMFAGTAPASDVLSFSVETRSS